MSNSWTDYNTLRQYDSQHTATHCNTLQHTATQVERLDANVYVKEVIGETSQVFSYDKPAPIIHTRGSNAPAAAATTLISISGAAFGAFDYSSALRFGGEAEARFEITVSLSRSL